MVERISRFFIEDDGARWSAILWSWLAGSVAGALLALAHYNDATLAGFSITISIVVFVGFLFNYAVESRPATVIAGSRRDWISYIYATATVLLFTVAERIFLNPEVVQAAALRLTDKIDGKNQVPPSDLTAVSVAARSISGRLPPENRRIVVIRTAILAATAYNAVLQALAEGRIRPLMKGLRLRLDPGGPGIGVLKVDGSALLDHIEFGSKSPESDGVNIACNMCDVVILESQFENLKQKLDGGIWFKSKFIKCRILYDGGNVVLVECEFTDCAFEFNPSVGSLARQMIISGTAVVQMSR